MGKKGNWGVSWRNNFLIFYPDGQSVIDYREFLWVTIRNVARLRGVDCARQVNIHFLPAWLGAHGINHEEYAIDLVYFRSTPHSENTLATFEKLLDCLFDGWENGCFPCNCQWMLHRDIAEWPYPED